MGFLSLPSVPFALIFLLILFNSGLTINVHPRSIPPESDLELFERSTTPCSPGGTPILYHNYTNQDCGPPKNLMGLGDNGELICPGNFADHCKTFCQAYQAFEYDVEVPVVASAYCHGPLTCTVTESMTTTWTVSGQVNAGLGSDWAKVISAGIQGGVSWAKANMLLTSKAVTLKEGQCGYMTFLPELHYSCGTISEGIWGNNKCNEYTTTDDICLGQGWKSGGSEVIGVTVFVWTNCSTNERLPMSQQDPAYQHPGVALPQSVYVADYQTCNCNEDGCTDNSPACCDNGSCPPGSGVVGG